MFKKAVVDFLIGDLEEKAAQRVSQLTLDQALMEIDRLFGCDRLLTELWEDRVIPYYTQSEWGYRRSHSSEGAIHMALNFDGVFNREGYYAQAQAVADHIEQIGACRVLEVGCGKGFNSLFLAQQYENVQFTGIDRTPLHIKIADEKASQFPNLAMQLGDYASLDCSDQSFDLVFGVECLCHAINYEVVLAELWRVLRPGGRLVVFDGYRQPEFANLSQPIQLSTQLTEASMAVQNGYTPIEDWNKSAKGLGLQILESEDISPAIEPTLLKLQLSSMKVFTSSWRARLLIFVLPQYLIRNIICGLLMPFVFNGETKSVGYYKLILERI